MESPREVQHEPLVVEGDDDVPHQPPDIVYREPNLSPVLPDARARRALLWAWPVVLLVIGIVVYAALN